MEQIRYFGITLGDKNGYLEKDLDPKPTWRGLFTKSTTSFKQMVCGVGGGGSIYNITSFHREGDLKVVLTQSFDKIYDPQLLKYLLFLFDKNPMKTLYASFSLTYYYYY